MILKTTKKKKSIAISGNMFNTLCLALARTARYLRAERVVARKARAEPLRGSVIQSKSTDYACSTIKSRNPRIKAAVL